MLFSTSTRYKPISISPYIYTVAQSLCCRRKGSHSYAQSKAWILIKGEALTFDTTSPGSRVCTSSFGSTRSPRDIIRFLKQEPSRTRSKVCTYSSYHLLFYGSSRLGMYTEMPTNHQGHTPQSEENKVIHA